MINLCLYITWYGEHKHVHILSATLSHFKYTCWCIFLFIRQIALEQCLYFFENLGNMNYWHFTVIPNQYHSNQHIIWSVSCYFVNRTMGFLFACCANICIHYDNEAVVVDVIPIQARKSHAFQTLFSTSSNHFVWCMPKLTIWDYFIVVIFLKECISSVWPNNGLEWYALFNRSTSWSHL